MVLRDLPEGRVAALMIAKTSARAVNDTCGPPYSRGMEILPRPLRVNCSICAQGRLALLVSLGGLYARGLGQLMGRAQRLGIVAQHNGRQQQGGDVQITLGGC